VWLAVASQDAAQGKQVLQQRWLSSLSDVERAAAAAVVDHSAAEITCPACGTRFASGPDECPDCGLYLGA
jgi:rubrerythrin